MILPFSLVKYRPNFELPSIFVVYYALSEPLSKYPKGGFMEFNEQEFRALVSETEAAVIQLGTTSDTVLDRYKRFADMLADYLSGINSPFELGLCLKWANSLEHDSAQALNASYVEWIALHRFIHLLAEQQAGTLNYWRHYLTQQPVMPQSAPFLEVLEAYRVSMRDSGYAEGTIKANVSYARKWLLFLESGGIYEIAKIQNRNVVEYFKTERFQDRKTGSVATETGSLKKFLLFLEQYDDESSKYLHCALPRIRSGEERIITTVSAEVEEALLEDEPDSLVNKRDQAVLLLALRAGLRGCDIRNLKFGDIDWEKETIHIRQKKTGADLEIPIDAATQNAIIDYVLHERRECGLDYIFITAVGPAQKLARRHYRIRYRAKGTEFFERLPHDGLHIYRRTFASRLLRSGVPLPVISDMLGHIDLNSARVYLSTDDEKMKRCALNLSLIPCQRSEY